MRHIKKVGEYFLGSKHMKHDGAIVQYAVHLYKGQSFVKILAKPETFLQSTWIRNVIDHGTKLELWIEYKDNEGTHFGGDTRIFECDHDFTELKLVGTKPGLYHYTEDVACEITNMPDFIWGKYLFKVNGRKLEFDKYCSYDTDHGHVLHQVINGNTWLFSVRNEDKSYTIYFGKREDGYKIKNIVKVDTGDSWYAYPNIQQEEDGKWYIYTNQDDYGKKTPILKCRVVGLEKWEEDGCSPIELIPVKELWFEKIAYLLHGQMRAFKKCKPTWDAHLPKGDWFVAAQAHYDDDEEMIKSLNPIWSCISSYEELVENWPSMKLLDDLKDKCDGNWCAPIYNEKKAGSLAIYNNFNKLGIALEQYQYDRIVLLRSDMYFTHPPPPIPLDENTLHVADADDYWGCGAYAMNMKGNLHWILREPYNMIKYPMYYIDVANRINIRKYVNIEIFLRILWLEYRGLHIKKWPINSFLTAEDQNTTSYSGVVKWDNVNHQWYKYTDDYLKCLMNFRKYKESSRRGTQPKFLNFLEHM